MPDVRPASAAIPAAETTARSLRPGAAPRRSGSPRSRYGLRLHNWPLWLGAAIIAFVALVGLAGPDLAPQDPLQETYIKQNAAGEWIKPPYPPLAVPGFLLGSDVFGRDLLSQLLWAVRPTLTLVLMVAAVRLTAGLVIGLIAGWSTGRLGRLLSSLISGALSAPVLFVALCVITLLGADVGVWAFIAGLALTGWAEVARTLREQTRAIKQRPYVEAAHALGASGDQLLYRHVLPQVMPLVWTMLAFEASSALLATAALGFLGYFMNSVWIPLGDWTGIRAGGKPDVGQMLAAAFETRYQPWGMVVAGSLVFLTVLGFNLLGEGLRQRLSLEGRRQRDTGAEAATGRVNDWIETRLFDPLSPWRRTFAVGSAAGALLLVLVGAGYNLWRSQAATRVIGDLPVPGGQLWATERHDPYGTGRTPALGPARPVVAWAFQADSGFAGGPAVDEGGTLYAATQGGTLYGVSASGAELWRAQLDTTPVGVPALNAFGDIYVADQAGGLEVFDHDGRPLWSVPGDGFAAIAGPIVAADNTAYYPTDGRVVAVTGEGRVKWRVNLPFYAYTFPLLSLSPDGQYVFFEDVALDAANGAVLTERTLDPFDRFFVGVDGKVYLGGANHLLEWRTNNGGAEIVPRAEFDGRALALGFRVLQAGGVTPEQRVWMLFNSPFEFAKLVWFDLSGNLHQAVDSPYRFGWLVGIDGDSTLYLCGGVEGQGFECRALTDSSRDPRWVLPLPEATGPVNGGALVNGRLYVTTWSGQLIAIDSSDQ